MVSSCPREPRGLLEHDILSCFQPWNAPFIWQLITLATILHSVTNHTTVAAADPLTNLRDYVQQLVDKQAFSGVISITHEGKPAFQEGFGLQYIEASLPYSADTVFPIGSNTKMITALAVWQLHEAGALDVDAPVSKYLDPRDFDEQTEYCPQVYGDDGSAACAAPSLKQLLNMGGGVLELLNHVQYPSGSWQANRSAEITNQIITFSMEEQFAGLGHTTPVTKLLKGWLWDTPLEFRPGTSFFYSNTGFWLVQYVIEKISRKPYRQYVQQHIFDALGMSRSYVVPIYDQPLIPHLVAALYTTQFNINISGVVGGELDVTVEYEDVMREAADIMLMDIAGAAGSVYSSLNMTTLWLTVISDPRMLSLSRGTVELMFRSYNPGFNVTAGSMVDNLPSDLSEQDMVFAQGMTIIPDTSFPMGVRSMMYLGGGYGFNCMMYMEVNRHDAAKSNLVVSFNGLKLDNAVLLAQPTSIAQAEAWCLETGSITDMDVDEDVGLFCTLIQMTVMRPITSAGVRALREMDESLAASGWRT